MNADQRKTVALVLREDLEQLRNYPIRAAELEPPYPIPYPVYRGSGSTWSLGVHLLRLWLWRIRMPRWYK
jgi:hypothetical protein